MNNIVFTLLAITVSFVITFIAGKIIIPLLIKAKAGQHVREDGPQTHIVKQGTPTMGGIIMLIGIVATSLIFTSGDMLFTGFCVLCVVAFSAIGFLDDSVMLFKKRSLGLRAWQKIVMQLAVSVFFAFYAYEFLKISTLYIPLANSMADLGIWFIPFTAFVLIAMVNSVNLTDGLDSLATKLTLLNALTFVVIINYFWIVNAGQDIEITQISGFSGSVAGACLGFLCFNAHPAKVFMGDTGSFALGAAITVMGITTSLQIMLPIMGFMFVLSSISVILQVGSFKLRHGKRIFKMAPLHHHFELKGIAETRVVSGYTIATALLCIGVLLLYFGGM